MYKVVLDDRYNEVTIVPNLWQASQEVRDYIVRYNLGASNFYGGKVLTQNENKLVARVSYNGRIWDLDGNELKSCYPREVRHYIKEHYNFDT
jgi:hypothetical protein